MTTNRSVPDRRLLAIAIAFGLAAALGGCGSKEPAATTPDTTPPAVADSGTADAAATQAAAPVAGSWSAEALEELLAPIALYPDPVLSQVLIASTNPQEVLDAGNWLIENQSLKGNALDDAAAAVGFTPPIRALVQFPETVDMMCLSMDWTAELGQAFTADQAGVLAAVQRLRRQAMDVGNLQSSAQMKVETEQQEGEDVVVVKPAQPDVVYVPQYDPVAVYAPLPADATTTAATGTTTTESAGHSTGALVTTGLLSFGAGILVNELFDDDDHHHRRDYYYPNYGYGGMPYYPPYPYRPSYGGGFRPGHNYNRPPGYNSGFQNNGNIIINTGGGNRPGSGGGGYWDRYDRPGSGNQGGYNRPRPVSSPITAARPNRPDLQEVNKRKPRPMPASVKPPSAGTTAANWKGQGSYKGARPSAKPSAEERIANAQPGYTRPATTKQGSRDARKPTPKVQGSYAGAKAGAETRQGSRPPVAKPGAATRDLQKPSAGRDLRNVSGGDRGHAKPASRPQPVNRASPAKAQKPVTRPSPATASNQRGSALSGSQRGAADRAASQRGKQSLPQGARSKGAHAKGGGGKGGGKKKH